MSMAPLPSLPKRGKSRKLRKIPTRELPSIRFPPQIRRPLSTSFHIASISNAWANFHDYGVLWEQDRLVYFVEHRIFETRWNLGVDEAHALEVLRAAGLPITADFHEPVEFYRVFCGFRETDFVARERCATAISRGIP